MPHSLRLLAVDLGAESGRALVGEFDGGRLQMHEVHRFPNVPVRLGGTLYWDFLRLFGDVVAGARAALAHGALASLGVDTWGVDFGLLDDRGRLLGNPVHYRDARTNGMLDRALARVTREQLYAATGIQLIPINTVYQLLSLVEARDQNLQRAARLLLMPDLMHHFLTGSDVCEYTNATTTQCFDVSHGTWSRDLLDHLRIPIGIFPDVITSGTRLGPLREDVADEVGSRVRVIAPATHDTASAVAATPLTADGHTAFLSSGTWSLLGLELDRPVLSIFACDANLTNEGGVGGTIRFLKNVMGLWLVQEVRSALARDDPSLTYERLTAEATSAAPFIAFIDPDDERFLRPGSGDLPNAVREYCLEKGQPPPSDPGGLVRVLLESLALKYAVVLRELEVVSGREIRTIHVVGGGSNNALLNQLTANATGRTVLAGPAEATAIGNLMVQAIALGELASIAEGRALVAASFPPQRYEPVGDWSEPLRRFEELRLRSQVQGVLQQ